MEGVAVSGFWHGRRVLVTGHTGFKGAWLTAWLELLGADVVGFALPPPTSPSLWDLLEPDFRGEQVIGDIRDRAMVDKAFLHEPEVIFHLAAQALVREGFREPADTFATNVQGTINVLDAATAVPSTRCLIVVTSDKVYEDVPENRPYDERSPVGGNDPYSASKACCELVVRAYRTSRFGPRGVPVATARAGNVIGGGDWSPERLVPDLVRAAASAEPLLLRYPQATRPWQHVLDPVFGYLLFAEYLTGAGDDAVTTLNFGPDAPGVVRVEEVVERWSDYFPGAPGWRQDAGPNPPEAPALELSSALAGAVLGWKAALSFDQALEWTADWYARQRQGESGVDLVRAQIRRYEELVR